MEKTHIFSLKLLCNHGHNFWDILIFHQIFLLPQVKPSVISNSMAYIRDAFYLNMLTNMLIIFSNEICKELGINVASQLLRGEGWWRVNGDTTWCNNIEHCRWERIQVVTYLPSHIHFIHLIYQIPTHSFGHSFPSQSFYRS